MHRCNRAVSKQRDRRHETACQLAAEHPVRPFSQMCWQVSRLADSGIFPNGRPSFPTDPDHGGGQWLGVTFPVTVAGAAALRGCPLSHSLLACHRQEPAPPELRKREPLSSKG